jgi:hypothetical protein
VFEDHVAVSARPVKQAAIVFGQCAVDGAIAKRETLLELVTFSVTITARRKH